MKNLISIEGRIKQVFFNNIDSDKCSVVKIRLANWRREQPEVFTCKMFKGLADQAAGYLKQDDLILIEGQLCQEWYNDKEDIYIRVVQCQVLESSLEEKFTPQVEDAVH